MTYEERIKLINAGYTKDEIEAMVTESEELAAGNEGVQGEQSAPSQVHESAVGSNDDIAKILQPLQEEIKKLGETVSAIQETNLKNASTASPNSMEDAIKDTIASFVNEL